MRRQLSLVLTLAAWLLATGSHWDLVQTFGWARMIVTYSHSMSLRLAVEKTFAGDALCGVCEVVQGAKEQQDATGTKAPGTKAPEKIVFLGTQGVLVYATPAPQCVGLVSIRSACLSADRAAPPLPPPRTLA